jgi:hypothetical protein
VLKKDSSPEARESPNYAIAFSGAVGAAEVNSPISTVLCSRDVGLAAGQCVEDGQQATSRGLIRSYRVGIEILYRSTLEAFSCSCYRVMQDRYDRLRNGAGRPMI